MNLRTNKVKQTFKEYPDNRNCIVTFVVWVMRVHRYKIYTYKQVFLTIHVGFCQVNFLGSYKKKTQRDLLFCQKFRIAEQIRQIPLISGFLFLPWYVSLDYVHARALPFTHL